MADAGASEGTRPALIRAALRFFGEKGFAATSTRALAAAAGTNVASLASHVGGKEGLRAACGEFIVETMGGMAASVLGTASARVEELTPAEAEALLSALVERMVHFVVAEAAAGAIVAFILRELSQPTAAFERIFEGVFAPVHERLCALWARATGESAGAEQVRIVLFTLIGQILYFRIAAEPVRRRMGWSAFGDAEAAAVSAAVCANLRAMVAQHRRPR
ncbi:MAG: CerR family C-terminal domain-containing protein [Pararhizobium sp.]